MADSSVNTGASGAPIRVLTGLGLGVADQQVVSLADAQGNLAPSDPDGTLQVNDGPTNLLFEAFDGTLANQWTASGTVAPAQSNGSLTFNSATTTSATSFIKSVDAQPLQANSYLQVGHVLVLDTTASVTNNRRWWGYGTNGTTYAAPIVNAAVFELDPTGAFYASIYSASTRTQTVTLTKPVDGLYHRYQIFFRTSRAYFLMDGALVATIQYPNTAVTNNQFVIGGSTNNTATAASVAPTMVWSTASAADGGANNHTISDGTFGSVRVAVKRPSTVPVVADTAMVVSQHPSGVTPAIAAGSQIIGAVNIGSTVPITSFSTSTTTNAATIVRTSGCYLQVLVISNTSTAVQYVKVYNATAVTLGTTAAVVSIPVAASSTVSLPFGPQGIRLSTGCCYAVTGGISATDNTAGAGGVLVAATVV